MDVGSSPPTGLNSSPTTDELGDLGKASQPSHPLSGDNKRKTGKALLSQAVTHSFFIPPTAFILETQWSSRVPVLKEGKGPVGVPDNK